MAVCQHVCPSLWPVPSRKHNNKNKNRVGFEPYHPWIYCRATGIIHRKFDSLPLGTKIFGGSLFLRIGGFLCFAGTNFCD